MANGYGGKKIALQGLIGLSLALLLYACGRLISLTVQDEAPKGVPMGLTHSVYAEEVHSVQLAPKGALAQGTFAPAAIPLAQPEPLILTFDVIEQDYTAYYAEVLLSRADGTLAQQVLVNTYLAGMNYFPITDHTLVSHTDPTYIRYRLEVPRVGLSGVYLLRVRRVDTKAFVMAVRFAVYESQIALQARVAFANRLQRRQSHHRLVVQADYSAHKGTDPHRDWYLVLRQNGNPNTDRVFRQPTRVSLADKQVIYEPLDGSADFQALMPFRFCDLRYLATHGVGVARIQRNKLRFTATLTEDQSRTIRDFTFQPDLNGGYQYLPDPQANYIAVGFRLFVPEPLNEVLFVGGHFNLWSQTPQYQLQYDSANRSYHTTLRLKQGYYNYLYSTPTQAPTEGAHINSENQYEAFLFVRPWGGIQDPLLGYTRFNGQL